MAKTAHTIYLDYQKAMRQADRLEEAAKKIRNEKSSLHSCRGSISSAWKGDNASAFIRKVSVVENDLASIEKSIRNAAAVIRRIAKETYDAEQRALTMAKNRKV